MCSVDSFRCAEHNLCAECCSSIAHIVVVVVVDVCLPVGVCFSYSYTLYGYALYVCIYVCVSLHECSNQFESTLREHITHSSPVLQISTRSTRWCASVRTLHTNNIS